MNIFIILGFSLVNVWCKELVVNGGACRCLQNTTIHQLPNDYTHLSLANGLDFLSISDMRPNRGISIAIAIAVGRNDDPPEHPGLTHLLEHTMFGTGNGIRTDETHAMTLADTTIYEFSFDS
eukprot:GHVO01035213.1.p1 GENE.GHVO01035213.1~~GHVO01035213.1.p1  ORF type:complete len:122 (+),score=9.43 GHVO01035213.1:21-386(+)